VNRNWHVLVVLLAPLTATGGAAPDSETSAVSRLAALQKQHLEAEAAFSKAQRKLPATPAGNKKLEELCKEWDEKHAGLFLAALDLAKADPKSDVGLAALEWVLTIPRAYYLPAGKRAMDLVREYHVTNPKVGKIVAAVGYCTHGEAAPSHASALALIRAVADKNPDRTARGQAIMALAWQAKEKFAKAESKQSLQTEREAAEAEKAFEAVVTGYADCLWLIGEEEGPRTLGEAASQELFALRHLRVGKTAGEIEGEDLDGSKFKLSDYRGKVVVLVFCGDWCAPCRAMYPHERSLVKKMEGKPFALIGVNSDPDREMLKKRLVDEKITWRWFWNGPKGPGGPISRAWKVRSWPTIYVLDDKGVIRHKDVPDKKLDEAVDELLGKLEQERKKGLR
jgi:thiol-disulfide isomerase/thioredoxin